MGGTAIHWPSFLTGSGLVIGGSALAGLFAFRGRVWVVFAGFVCFLEGYRTAQRGTDWLTVLRTPLRERPAIRTLGRESVRWGLMLVGMFGIAAGVTTFAQAIVDPSVQRTILAGLYSVGGYIWAHSVLHHDPL